MKLREEFTVPHGVDDVWGFLEQPEAVAACMPGVEAVKVLDADNVQVRATQSIGPMTATFEAKVAVSERVPRELIRFRATGRSVRGAVGNLRTENTVRLQPSGDGTTLVVEGDVVLAGALGSVGQKIVSKQAAKVTAEFASNLASALRGEAMQPARAGSTTRPSGAPGWVAPPGAARQPVAAEGQQTDWDVAMPAAPGAAEIWSKVSAVASIVSALISVWAIVRVRRSERP